MRKIVVKDVVERIPKESGKRTMKFGRKMKVRLGRGAK